MDCNGLRPQQTEILREQLARQLAYLGRLRKRMEHLHFPHEDELYVAACDAFNAMQALHIRAHYLACRSGVGRPAAGRS